MSTLTDAEGQCCTSHCGTKRMPAELAQSHKRVRRTEEQQEPLYYPTTKLLLPQSGGWMVPCRYCRSWTASSLATTDGGEVSICRRCQGKLGDYIQTIVQRHDALTSASLLPCGAEAQCCASDPDSSALSSPMPRAPSILPSPTTSAASSLLNSTSGSGASTPNVSYSAPSPSCLHACLLAAQQLQQQQHYGTIAGGTGTQLCEYASGAHGLLQRLVAEQQAQHSPAQQMYLHQ